MDTKTKTTSKTIEISGMTGDACVQTVVAALKKVSGVTIDAVQVGTATITCGYPAALDAACNAITSAGFKSQPAGGRGAPATPAKSAPGIALASAPAAPGCCGAQEAGRMDATKDAHGCAGKTAEVNVTKAAPAPARS